MINSLFAKTCILTLACALSACVSTGAMTSNTDKIKPQKLTSLDNSADVINKIAAFRHMSLANSVSEATNIRPVFTDNRVFFASKSGQISAQDGLGNSLWEIQTKHHITGGISYDKYTKTLVLSTRAGLVIALDADSGELKWQRQLSGSIITPAAISYRENRVVLSANDGILHGLYLKTGRPAWSYSTPTPKISIRGTALPVLHKDIAVFATADGRVYILDAKSGEPVWSKQVADIKLNSKNENDDTPKISSKRLDYLKDVDVAPVFDGNYMYTVSYGGQLKAFDLRNKALAYTHDVSSLKQLLVANNLLVVVTNTSEVHAYDKVSGKLLWKNSDLTYRQLTNPEFVANHIVVGDYKGYLHLLSLTTGKIVSRERAKGKLKSLQVTNNKLIVQDSLANISIWQKQLR